MGIFGSIISAAGSIIGGSKAKKANKKAFNAYKQYNEQAQTTLRNAVPAIEADYQPYVSAGLESLPTLRSFIDRGANFGQGDFQTDPGYQFRLAEGQKALERSAAARGGNLSGASLKALTDYNQGSASAEYQNAYQRWREGNDTQYGRLRDLVGLGYTSARDLGQVRYNTAGSLGNLQEAIGSAAAGQYAANGKITAGQWSTGGNALSDAADMFAGKIFG